MTMIAWAVCCGDLSFTKEISFSSVRYHKVLGS